MENQNANTQEGNKFSFQSYKLYRLSKLKKHCQNLEWNRWEEPTFTSGVEGSSFHSSQEVKAFQSMTCCFVFTLCSLCKWTQKESEGAAEQGKRGNPSLIHLLALLQWGQIGLGLSPNSAPPQLCHHSKGVHISTPPYLHLKNRDNIADLMGLL